MGCDPKWGCEVKGLVAKHLNFTMLFHKITMFNVVCHAGAAVIKRVYGGAVATSAVTTYVFPV